MRDEHPFGECYTVERGRYFGGNACEVAEISAIAFAERQWHQRGSARNNVQPELASDVVAERRGANLRNRESARRNDEGLRRERPAFRVDDETVRERHPRDRAAK